MPGFKHPAGPQQLQNQKKRWVYNELLQLLRRKVYIEHSRNGSKQDNSNQGMERFDLWASPRA